MGLRVQAELDAVGILEDDVSGFGYAIKVTDPTGIEADLKGFSNDISQLIDPDTGQAVSGGLVTVTLPVSSIEASVLTGIPVGVAEKTAKPWLVEFDDINGNPGVFKVAKSDRDRGLGIIVLTLETYNK